MGEIEDDVPDLEDCSELVSSCLQNKLLKNVTTPIEVTCKNDSEVKKGTNPSDISIPETLSEKVTISIQI